MEFDLVSAIIAGLAGTGVMTAMMMMAPKMGMPEMDIPQLLSSMFGAPGNKMMGMGMHVMMGVVFSIIYALLFDASGNDSVIVLGIIYGAGHWIVAGLMMAGMPMMHKGIQSGDVDEPGLFMLKKGGMMGFMGGLMGHMVFGLVVGVVYQVLVG
jgi:hypothetical protein